MPFELFRNAYHNLDSILRIYNVDNKHYLEFANGVRVEISPENYATISEDLELISNSYFNKDKIFRTYELHGQYWLDFVTGLKVEITQQEYENIINSNGGKAEWGGITGNIDDQQDLKQTYQAQIDNSLETESKNIAGAINEINILAKQADKAKSFVNYESLIEYLNSAEATQFNPGQIFNIQSLSVPDLWVYSVEPTSVPYSYTTDDAFVTATGVDGGQQVGYYKLAQMETKAPVVKSVNGTVPDENGNIQINEVPFADNLVSPDNNIDDGEFIYRTSGGSQSISTGTATISRIKGNCNVPEKTEESIITTHAQGQVTLIGTKDASVFGALVNNEQGTYTLTCSNNKWNFSFGEMTYSESLSFYGIGETYNDGTTGDEGDVIYVTYTPGGGGATPFVVGQTYEKVYFDTSKSVEEMTEILGGLEYDDDGAFIYISDNSGEGDGIYAQSLNELFGFDGYAIVSTNGICFFSTVEIPQVSAVVGWQNLESDNSYTFEPELHADEVNNQPFMSVTPFGGAESISTEVVVVDFSFTLDEATFKTQVSTSGITTFNYNGSSWSPSISQYGISVSGHIYSGASIVVNYTKKDYGTITYVTLGRFVSSGFNQANPDVYLANADITNTEVVSSSGKNLVYVRVVKGNTYTVYAPSNSGIKVATCNSAPTIGASIHQYIIENAEEVVHITPEYDYIVISCDVNTCVHPTWSGYMDEVFSDYVAPSVIYLERDLFSDGLYRVENVCDEINIDRQKFIKRIEKVAISAQSRQYVEELGTPYLEDETYFYYIKPNAVETSIVLSGEYDVDDFGTEEFTVTTVAPLVEIVYGQNLRDKLRTDVLTLSPQTLTQAQKEQVWANLGLDSISGVLF